MRGFLITICLFSLLLSLMIINYRYIDNLQKEITSQVNILDNHPSEKNTEVINDIKNTWDRKKIWLCIAVEQNHINTLNEAIDAIYFANEYGDIGELCIAINNIKRALKEISVLERISLANIL